MALMKAFVGDEQIINRYYKIILPLQFQTNIIILQAVSFRPILRLIVRCLDARPRSCTITISGSG